ncbi:MarR family transcriptional regulator [Paracoccus caeni]|uniref:MarR family transcriptional regulator n=1 Tax=Paracoccus caeni TaxID=657651 RepID=A0A934SGJ7_9RHOB|nr:MarR family transcriptional regulator [Paracoccus caeni]MBK4214789.1 MarR family transcriptional regulator [Paracoccus caeni]
MEQNPTLSSLLCFDIYSANLAFGRLYKPLLDPLGLTYPQYLALVLLWERDGQSVSEIGGSLGLESSTLTPLLKRLETAGLLRRLRDNEDERRVRIFLTDQGRDLQTKAAGVAECVAKATGLGADEAVAMQTALIRLRSALETAQTS